MPNRTTVLTIDAAQVRDLRRMVDLLSAIQVCWPSAQATYHKNEVVISIAGPTSGALAA